MTESKTRKGPKQTMFTVPAVPGSMRTSPRNYTHAIVGRQDLATARAHTRSTAFAQQETRNWNFYAETARLGPGGQRPVTGCARPWKYTISESDAAAAVRFLEEHPTAEGFVASVVARELARIDAIGTGDAGPLAVLQWCQSLANATKALGGKAKYFVGVEIMETQRVIRHAKDTWRILSTGATRADGATYAHLASLTRHRQQQNGPYPIQIEDFVQL